MCSKFNLNIEGYERIGLVAAICFLAVTIEALDIE